MATTTWTSVLTNTSDVNFRDWGSKLSAGLTAVGMVKTSDTGQINWSTVTAPAAINTQMGYEVWRFNDALQSTAPIFLRIGYGSGAVVNTPAIWITIGKASDGAGTITGVMQAAVQSSSGVNSASPQTSYASGKDGIVAFSLAPSLILSTNSIWVIERSRNTSGAATADGLTMVTPNATSTTLQTFAYAYSTATSSGGVSGYPVGLPVNSANNVGMSISGSAPVYLGTAYVAGYIWQPRGVVVGMRSDVGTFGTIVVPGLDTYFSLGLAGEKADVNVGAYATACMVWS